MVGDATAYQDSTAQKSFTKTLQALVECLQDHTIRDEITARVRTGAPIKLTLTADNKFALDHLDQMLDANLETINLKQVEDLLNALYKLYY